MLLINVCNYLVCENLGVDKRSKFSLMFCHIDAFMMKMEKLCSCETSVTVYQLPFTS
jgi:hypothetical protein